MESHRGFRGLGTCIWLCEKSIEDLSRGWGVRSYSKMRFSRTFETEEIGFGIDHHRWAFAGEGIFISLLIVCSVESGRRFCFENSSCRCYDLGTLDLSCTSLLFLLHLQPSSSNSIRTTEYWLKDVHLLVLFLVRWSKCCFLCVTSLTLEWGIHDTELRILIPGNYLSICCHGE